MKCVQTWNCCFSEIFNDCFVDHLICLIVVCLKLDPARMTRYHVFNNSTLSAMQHIRTTHRFDMTQARTHGTRFVVRLHTTLPRCVHRHGDFRVRHPTVRAERRHQHSAVGTTLANQATIKLQTFHSGVLPPIRDHVGILLMDALQRRLHPPPQLCVFGELY